MLSPFLRARAWALLSLTKNNNKMNKEEPKRARTEETKKEGVNCVNAFLCLGEGEWKNLPSSEKREMISTVVDVVKDEPIVKPCRNCKKPVKSTEKFCQECGAKVELDVKKNCPSCNKPLKGIEKFCTECGHDLTTLAK